MKMVFKSLKSKSLIISILYLFTLIKLYTSNDTENRRLEADEYPNLFENDVVKIRNFLENFNFTEYEESCVEAKYEKCYEISSYYINKLKFTNFTEISTKYSSSNEIELDPIKNLENYDNRERSESAPEISNANVESEEPKISLDKDEVTLYNNILSNFYYYAGVSEYYGIIKKKSDLANGFGKFVISAYYGNSKALYELYVILESNIYKIIFDLKQYKSLLQTDTLLKYISENEFYNNFKFESDYEKNSIALVFLYTSSILKYPPALNTLAHKFYIGNGVEKSCDTSLKYYKEISMLNVQKITNRKKPNHYEKVNLVAYEYAGFLQSKENMNINAIIDYLKVEASNGHTNVMQQLGQKFLFGQGTEQNFHESFTYFKLGYLHNDTLCTYYLAEHYLNGWGVEANYTEAYNLLNRAVSQQYDLNANKDKNNKQYVAKALNSIGYMYYYGMGVEKNVKRAYDYFKRAINLQEDADAYYNMVTLITEGNDDIKVDYATAYKYSNFIAARGHTFGTHIFGMLNDYNLGSMIKSCEITVEFFKQVAERNLVSKKRFELAIKMYMEEYYKLSALLFVQLAEEGIDMAQINAGILFKNYDIFIDQGFNKYLSFRYFKKSTKTRNAYSYIALGDFYHYGFGELKANYTKATKYYKKAIRSSIDSKFYLSHAYFNLGVMYQLGKGVIQSNEKASKYYEMSYAHEPLAYYPAIFYKFYMNFEFRDLLNLGLIKTEELIKSLFTPGHIMYFFVGFIFFYLIFLISLLRQKNN